MNHSLIAILQQRRVNGGGVTLQRHIEAQSVTENARHNRPLGAESRFLFHQGCQCDHTVYIVSQGEFPELGFATLFGMRWSSCGRAAGP